MPKLKTRKSIAKRLKQTGTMKYIRKQAGKSHILTKKSTKRKKRLAKQVPLASTDLKKVKSSLPYGLNH